MRPTEEIFAQLSNSRFRSRFHLHGKDIAYIDRKSLETVLGHARDFIDKRLAPAAPANDGKQTPFRGHPVFIAQHATATCCRTCLSKWHGIPIGHELHESEREHILKVLEQWLTAQLDRHRAQREE